MTVSFNSYNIILTPLTSSLYKERRLPSPQNQHTLKQHWLRPVAENHVENTDLPGDRPMARTIAEVCRSFPVVADHVPRIWGAFGHVLGRWEFGGGRGPLCSPLRLEVPREGRGRVHLPEWVYERWCVDFFFSFIKSMCNSSCFIDLFITVYQLIPL